MLLISIIYLFRFESSLLEKISNYLSLVLLIIGLNLSGSWYFRRKPHYIGSSLTLLNGFWFIMIVWFLIVPLVFFDSTNNTFIDGMMSDYRYLLFSIMPFLLVSDYSVKYYNKIWDSFGALIVFLGLISLFIVDKSSIITSERGTQGLPYYLWWSVICVYPYLFLKSVFINNDIKGYTLLFLNLVLSLFFIKRTGFVGTSYFLIVAVLFSTTNKIFGSKIFQLSSVFIFIFLLLYFGYLDSMIGRFERDASDIDNFDRLVEIDEFFSNASMANLLTGFGANNYISMTYIGIEDKEVRALHIGFYNILYKGGVMYILFMIFFTWQVLSLWKYRDVDREILIGFLIGFYSILSLSFEGSWSYMPYHFFKLLPIYRAIYLKDKYLLNIKKAVFN